MTIDELYPRVTAAIERAERLEKNDPTSAEPAYLEVSMLEDAIADLLPPGDPEGMIARRGAIEAALSANLPARALDLVERYVKEDGAPAKLVAEFAALANELRQKHPASDDPLTIDLNARYHFAA